MDFSTFLFGVLTSIVAAILLAIFARSKGWIHFSFRSLVRDIRLYKRLKSAGLTNFYASRDDFARYRGAPRLLDFLSSARRSINIVAYWMAHGVEMEGVALELANLTKPPRNLDVTIGMIDPTAPYLESLASYLDMETNELRLRVQSSLTRLRQARETLAPQEQARLKIKVYKFPPIASVIILDAEEPDGRVQLDIKAYKTPRQFSFAFELSNSGHYLHDHCRNAWIRLLEDAEDFDTNRHIR